MKLVFLLAITFAGFLTCVFTSGIAIAIKKFTKEKKYIKMEIKRSDVEERQYWKMELNKLYLSCLPFVK